MKIAVLHMTMGLTNRGSEVVVDQVATQLAHKHQVLVIQSGPVIKKLYAVKRVSPLQSAPPVAPSSLLDKLLFRLHLDRESGEVADFTVASIPTLIDFAPDIIIAINGPTQLRILQGQALKAKLVTFGHAGIGYHDRDTLSARPDLFVALSPSAYHWASGRAKSQTKVVYIPNPRVDKDRGKIKLNLPSPVVLTVAALSKYKNVDKVIDALRATPASLLLIGDGEERKKIATLLSTFSNDFRWIHSLPPSEIASYYNSADVFCFVPDTQEAFGMVYLEAMAAGLPIVASDDPVRHNLIGEDGIYVRPHDISAITEGINQAIQLGKIDYSRKLKPYNLLTVVRQIEEEFHDIIR